MRQPNERLKQFHVHLGQLCNADYDVQLRFALVMTVDDVSRVFASFDATLSQLTQSGGNATLNGPEGSTIQFTNTEIFTPPSFVDYLRAGWQISFVAGIDYTGSNGVPTNP